MASGWPFRAILCCSAFLLRFQEKFKFRKMRSHQLRKSEVRALCDLKIHSYLKSCFKFYLATAHSYKHLPTGIFILCHLYAEETNDRRLTGCERDQKGQQQPDKLK